MADLDLEAIARMRFDAAELIQRHPPRFEHAHKRTIVEGVVAPIDGDLDFSRWRGRLPDSIRLGSGLVLEQHEDVFEYPPEEPGCTSWHLNFADRHLFGYYGGPLLAQDEHQVLEHPVLGALREALLDLSKERPELAPLTRESGPTPCLAKGAQRSLHFDTVRGPYGNAFATSSVARIRDATSYPGAPSHSNILAIAAPSGGYGEYSDREIEDILETASVGFAACRAESASTKTVIHTGNWGCGAFGGNVVMMVLLQVIAARLAGVDRLVFHTVLPASTRGYTEALSVLDRLPSAPEVPRQELVSRIQGVRLRWGVSDGN